MAATTRRMVERKRYLPKTSVWTAVEGIPSAPLIGESKTGIDLKFMKMKQRISSQLPMLTSHQLLEHNKRESVKQRENIVAFILTDDFQEYGSEAFRMIREDIQIRESGKHEGTPHPWLRPLPLNQDIGALKNLLVTFRHIHGLLQVGDWMELLLVRLEAAAELWKEGERWLGATLVRNSLELLPNLDPTDMDGRLVKAEVHLCHAYALMNQYQYPDDTRIDAETMHDIRHHLKECTAIMADNKEAFFFQRSKKGKRRHGLPSINIPRLIAMHGWENFDEFIHVSETLTLEDTSLYQMSKVVMSQLLLKDTKDCQSLQCERDIESDEAKVKFYEERFYKAISDAIDAKHASNLFEILYEYGQYLVLTQNYLAAEDLYNQLNDKALTFEDPETACIALNELAVLKASNGKILDAVNDLCEEWELGRLHHHPLIQSDAAMLLRQLLSEEGHFLEARELCWHSYQLLHSLTAPKAHHDHDQHHHHNQHDHGPRPPSSLLDKDVNLESSWMMCGITGGMELYPRFASYCRYTTPAVEKVIAEWRIERIQPPPYLPRYTLQELRLPPPIPKSFEQEEPQKRKDPFEEMLRRAVFKSGVRRVRGNRSKRTAASLQQRKVEEELEEHAAFRLHARASISQAMERTQEEIDEEIRRVYEEEVVMIRGGVPLLRSNTPSLYQDTFCE